LILQANATQIPIKDKSVQLCCFSPPYWGLRKYDGLPEILWPDGDASDLGLEPSPELYLDHMALVMAEVWRVLRDDGVCFVNIGDTYSASRSYQVVDNKHKDVGNAMPMNKSVTGIPQKSLCLIPQKFAIRCQAAGWIIRSEIIWAKPNPMPESVRDRPTRSHEQVWMMTKRGRYFWDRNAARQPVARSTIRRGPVSFGGAKGRNYNPDPDDPNYRGGNEQWGRTYQYNVKVPGGWDTAKRSHGSIHKDGRTEKKYQDVQLLGGVNIRDVWTIPAEPTPEAHFATWPKKLVEKMIRAGSAPGDIVLDPFCGTAKTVIEAERLNRIGVGLDLSWPYLSEIAMPRKAIPLQRELIA